MKKFLLILLILLLGTASYAVEITVIGKGSAPLTGYDIGATRSREDKYMESKSKKTKTEVMSTQQIKEATREAEKRVKQDLRMNDALRGAVIVASQEDAEKNAIAVLVDRVLGANASKKTEVAEKLDDLYSQNEAYVLDKEYLSGVVIDNNYVSKVQLTVDETAFRELVSDLGIALNTAAVRKGGILVVLDEFFAAPSNMKENVLTKEVTTLDYKYSEKDKESEKLNYKDSNNASIGRLVSAKQNTNLNYGSYVDYSQNESLFFENVKEYAPKAPAVQNLNYTQPALVNAFSTYDIRSIDNGMFKSKFFKGKPLSADKLQDSEVLANYVNFAKTDAKADFFAIGVSYIVDNGKNENTGKHTCDGNVFVKIYSTQDGEVIASGSLTETAAGNSSDQARAAVADKIGNELGEVLSKKIQDYWKRRMMYGSEYVLEVKGKFLPAERMAISNALKSGEGIKNVSLRVAEPGKVEYVLNYNGSDPVGDAIFVQLINASGKFNNYDYKINANQIIFTPVAGGDNL